MKSPGVKECEEQTSIVGRAIVVLDFLNQDERRALEIVDNVGGNPIQVRGSRREVLDVVGPYGQPSTVARGGEFCRGWQSRLGRGCDLQARQR